MNRTLEQLCRTASDLGAAPDAQLIADFVALRDDQSFAQLVRRHGPMVFAVCRRVLRHQHDAEDAFQATFLVLARKADDVWPRDAVGAWLHGVAYRVAMKARVVRARQTRRELTLEDVALSPPDPPCPDLADVLDRAIRKLPEVYRAAVVACDLEGRTRKDAAEQLGWKEGTLSGRLARARQLLAARLKKAGLVVAVPTATTLPVGLAERAVAAAVTRGGVSAPVAALTEGVVRGMALVKIKVVAVVTLAVGTMGLGVWSASGQGQGEGGPPAKKAAAGETPRVDYHALARQEIDQLTREMSLPAKPGETAEDRAARFDRLLTRLDTAAHLLTFAQDGAARPPAQPKEPPDLDRLQGEWVMCRPNWHINPSVPKSTIDSMIRNATPEGRFVFAGGKVTFIEQPQVGASGKAMPVSPRTFTVTLDATQFPKHIDLSDENGGVVKGIYHIEGWYAVLVIGGRDGRPKSFDTPRPAGESMWTLRRRDAEDLGSPIQLYGEEKLQADYERARTAVLAARAELEQAKHERVAADGRTRKAELSLHAAEVQMKTSFERLLEAKKVASPVPAAASYTVYVRPPLEAEKVETHQLVGSVTVLDALQKAKGVVLSSSNATVWLVRDGTVLPVDYVGIVQHGVTATNYQLRNGDKLFVQVNHGK